MNDNWVELSKKSNIATVKERSCYLSGHEIWLDYMNLHETSWMLFAGKDAHYNECFGWPRLKGKKYG
ncbi:hypothetical protein LCGC14_2487920 [marine sediment metagenome]|uniref:Uncharacterized protein n=1 Tax=marine sediment metagenome TaxID=412755 RepID=A0A0F9DZG1_9ZZZZ